jgi:hypothetical protein
MRIIFLIDFERFGQLKMVGLGLWCALRRDACEGRRILE